MPLSNSKLLKVKKTLHLLGVFIFQNVANFEAFCQTISSSISWRMTIKYLLYSNQQLYLESNYILHPSHQKYNPQYLYFSILLSTNQTQLNHFWPLICHIQSLFHFWSGLFWYFQIIVFYLKIYNICNLFIYKIQITCYRNIWIQIFQLDL